MDEHPYERYYTIVTDLEQAHTLLRDALAVMERLQHKSGVNMNACPVCWMNKSNEHASDCELADVLRRAGEV